MTSSPGPAVQRRKLSLELKRLRSVAGINQHDVAAQMEWSISKLIRIERGQSGISANDLKILLSYLEVNDEVRRAELLEMARIARKRPWAQFRKELSKEFLAYLDFEFSAGVIRDFSLALVPGLLQTEEYTRTVLSEFNVSDSRIDLTWRCREMRQELHTLTASSPRMIFVIDESVIRRQIGRPRTMIRQIEHLLEMSTADHIQMHVLPFSAGATRGLLGHFIILEPEDPTDDLMLYMETPPGTVITQDRPELTREFLDAFESLVNAALPPDESRVFLDGVLESLMSAT